MNLSGLFFMKNRSKTIPYVLVTLQFSSLIYLIFSGPKIAQGWAGLVLETAGVLLGLIAIYVAGIHNVNVAPLPKSGGKLITTGPYALIRHPMYLAQVVALVPLVFDYPKPLRTGVLILLCIVLIIKIEVEEKGLIEQFGNDYIEYKKKTARVLPFVY